MSLRFKRGQEATEFVLISILVFFSALLVVFLFGNKISKFFTEQSSASKVSKNSSIAINPNNQQKYNTEIENYNGSTKTTAGTTSVLPENITMPDITENADGSLSFTAGEQNVTLPSQIKDLSNVVFETTGSSGAQDLIKEVALMIDRYKSEFPDGDVPVEISFGKGTRALGYNYETYQGTAEANSISIQAGNHIVIIQNDQTCIDNQATRQYTNTCSKSGKYRIEGDIQEFKNAYNGDVYYRRMDGTVTSSVNKDVGYINIYDINPSSGIKLHGSYNGYDWKIDLSNKFNI